MKKYCHTTWFMVLMLFVFPPVGIVLLWRYFKGWNMGIKVTLSVVFGLCFFSVFVGVVAGIVEYDDAQNESTNAITQTTILSQQNDTSNPGEKLSSEKETTSSDVQTTATAETVSTSETTQTTTKSTTKPVSEATTQNPTHSHQGETYVLNTDTKKIHRPSCHHVSNISDENYAETNDYDKAIEQGYVPCKTCNP